MPVVLVIKACNSFKNTFAVLQCTQVSHLRRKNGNPLSAYHSGGFQTKNQMDTILYSPWKFKSLPLEDNIPKSTVFPCFSFFRGKLFELWDGICSKKNRKKDSSPFPVPDPFIGMRHLRSRQDSGRKFCPRQILERKDTPQNDGRLVKRHLYFPPKKNCYFGRYLLSMKLA